VKVVVATDRSATARQAVVWAANLARGLSGELVLVQVLAEPEEGAEERLAADARELDGASARAVVRVDSDAAAGIVRAAEEEAADVLVVGNAGMGGRTEFLLGNVPNRVSHAARCTVVIVNTTDGTVHEPPPEVAEEGGLLGRAAEIGRVLARLGVDVRKAASPLERARRLRRALEQLGPTFAKLGQILSTRPDLIPPEVADELAKLQDDVAPLSEEEVVRVMEQELRVPWEDVFASIEPMPLAAGTIGQVHRATLESGERVVVKVQRPSAREEITRDLGLLELFAEKALEREALRGAVDIPALVQHLSESLRRELDFLQEAANTERMREALAPYPRLGVPRVHGDLSTSRLLVLEYVEGIPIRASQDSPERREAGKQLLEAFYRQILADGFFHADPHPGNLLWSGERLYLLDLGMVGELGAAQRELVILLLLAFARDDPAFLAEAVLLLSGEELRADLDLEALEREFADFVAEFQVSSLQDVRLGPMLDGLIRIAARHGLRLPAALALSGKAFGQVQLAIAELDPTLDPFRVVGSFLVRNVRERAFRQADPQRLYYEGQKLKVRAGRLIEAIERATGARPGPKLQVDFLGAAPIERAIRRAGRLLSLAALAAACVVGAASTAAADTAAWVPIAFASVGAVLGLWLVLELAGRSQR
jgi:predicted unusual protein kinase regulating ubiquinone biosynthesis (AarF/ABC1/UbiB family)/nucleotide-binding universal stress UspA family protein